MSERTAAPDVVFALQLRDLEAGQQRLVAQVEALAPLLEKIVGFLEAQQSPPPPPIASYTQLYPSLGEATTLTAAEPVNDPLPVQPGGWRRLFAARSSKIIAGGVLVMACTLPWWRLNLTASAPRGLWLRHAVPAVVERGMWVTLPTPASVQRWHDTWVPLLKPVAAVAGDQVCVTQQTLHILGRNYGYVAHVAHGEVIPHAKEGCFTVGAGEVFLASDRSQSLDSRYFGPVPVTTLTAQATPFLTWR